MPVHFLGYVNKHVVMLWYLPYTAQQLDTCLQLRLVTTKPCAIYVALLVSTLHTGQEISLGSIFPFNGLSFCVSVQEDTGHRWLPGTPYSDWLTYIVYSPCVCTMCVPFSCRSVSMLFSRYTYTKKETYLTRLCLTLQLL